MKILPVYFSMLKKKKHTQSVEETVSHPLASPFFFSPSVALEQELQFYDISFIISDFKLFHFQEE